MDKLADGGKPVLTYAARVLTGKRSGVVSLHKGFARHVWNHEHVYAVTEMAGLEISIVNTKRREIIVVKNPAGPAFVDVSHPGAIETYARFTHRSRIGGT